MRILTTTKTKVNNTEEVVLDKTTEENTENETKGEHETLVLAFAPNCSKIKIISNHSVPSTMKCDECEDIFDTQLKLDCHMKTDHLNQSQSIKPDIIAM